MRELLAILKDIQTRALPLDEVLSFALWCLFRSFSEAFL